MSTSESEEDFNIIFGHAFYAVQECLKSFEEDCDGDIDEEIVNLFVEQCVDFAGEAISLKDNQ